MGAKETRFPPRTILVPVDFSEGSMAGLAAARILGERWRSKVELVHVDQGPPPAYSQGADLWTAEALAIMRSSTRHRLEEAAEGIPRAATHVLEGAPGAIVPRLAADAAADLIVLGPRRRRKLPKFLAGSLAERSVHDAGAPVLSVRSRPDPGWPRRILAPVKWAPYADRALTVARAWAEDLEAELGLLHVFEGGSDDPMERRALIEHATSLLGERARTLTWHWVVGRPFEEIPRIAQVGGYDLIVVAEHVRNAWVDAFLGTTAERVLRASAVSVLSVPGEPGKRKARR